MSGVALLTLIMANIGTTITPWQIFFQQSAVVDKGMDVKQIKYGKFDTLFGSFMTCVVAAFIIIAAAGVFYYNPANPNAANPGGGHRGQSWPPPAPGRRLIPRSTVGRTWIRPPRRPPPCPQSCPAVRTGASGPRLLFAIGLFDAGLLGALCISLATSWALGEVFGWAHSLNRSVREAPWFYVAYVLMLMSAGRRLARCQH
jgi:Mn2+/Fe2+ NRAMP family transporter